ncbi:MAG: ImmA/IrrE family metallo-endopeptidase [Lentisphaeria bacterium]|nr:ImmA/IrrE family metallo-endopeptidase [Lentisphaeria bacterium]
MENHANEFAGRLLVPEDILRFRYEQAKSKVPEAAWEWDASGETVRQYIADALSSEFGVSSQVLEKRILFESL